MRASPLWSALVRAGRGLRCRALEYWSTGVLGYWNTGVLEYWSTGVLGPRCPLSYRPTAGLHGSSWREGSGVQPATERFRSRVRVGVAGPGRRPSARHSPLVCSGARRSGVALAGPGVLVGERAVGFSPQPNGSEVGCALG